MKYMRATTKKRLGSALAVAAVPKHIAQKREPIQRTLFAGPAVSDEDIARWAEAVGGVSRESPRFAGYVRGYRVAEKVAEAKKRGRFEAIVSGGRGGALERWRDS